MRRSGCAAGIARRPAAARGPAPDRASAPAPRARSATLSCWRRSSSRDPEVLVGDVQRGEHRDLQGVAGRAIRAAPAASSRRRTPPARRRRPDRARCGSGTAARGSRRSRRGTIGRRSSVHGSPGFGLSGSPLIRSASYRCRVALDLRSMSPTRERISSRSSRSAASFGAGPFGFGERARAAPSSSRASRAFSSDARALSAAQPVDHADQHLDFLFEPIDRLEVDAACITAFANVVLLVDCPPISR